MKDGNWNKIRRELADIGEGLRTERADQSGWTHEYMQAWRTICRLGPVTMAHVCGLGLPALIVGGVLAWLA